MSDQPHNTYRTIIVGFDGSAHARDALAFAGALSRATGANVVAACVYQLQAVAWPADETWLRVLRSEAEKTAELATEAGMVESDQLETQVIGASSAARGLHSLADDVNADLIVVGSAHRGRVGQVLAGSVGHGLLHGSPCAVAVAPAGLASRAPGSIGRIVVAFDGSAESLHALEGAVGLAESTGARVGLAVVAEPPAPAYGKGGGMVGVAELEEAIHQHMEEQLQMGLGYANGGPKIEGSVLRGHPAERLREAAADADVLMMGSRSYGPLRTVLLGSVSGELIRSAPCTVVVYPRGVESTEGQSGRDQQAVAGDTV